MIITSCIPKTFASRKAGLIPVHLSRNKSDVGSILSFLAPDPASKTLKQRLGRGPASGRGGHTVGRGENGQKSRSGHRQPYIGFTSGRSPLYKLYGRMKPLPINPYTQLSLGQLDIAIKRGRIDTSKPITMHHLIRSGCVKEIGVGVELISEGSDDFFHPINITVSRADAESIKAIEALGGTIICKYYSRGALDALLYPEKYILLERKPKSLYPKTVEDIIYYTNIENRGYIFHLVKEIDESLISQTKAQERLVEYIYEALEYGEPRQFTGATA